MNASFLQPRMLAYINGQFIPSWSVEVEQTVYSHADTAKCTTFCADQPTDFGALSQAQAYIPFKVEVIDDATQKTALPVFQGYLDEIDTDYLDNDTIDFSSRGILSLLIDKKTTQKSNMNVDVGDVIRSLITSVGLPAQVGTAGISVGKIAKEDTVTLSRNVPVMDYINGLTSQIGWETRVLNGTVIVGPPPENVPTFQKAVDTGGLLKCTVKHSALHAHNIKVTVLSYIPKRKSKTSGTASGLSATDLLLLNGQTLNLPSPKSPASASGGGVQSGNANPAQAEDNNKEQYVFHIPGLTKDQCDARASLLQEEISRHEFILEIEFTPTAAEIVFLSQNSPEFLINLTGCSQQSHNQLYHPRKVTWTWDMTDEEASLKVAILAVNHVIPQDSDGGVNSNQ